MLRSALRASTSPCIASKGRGVCTSAMMANQSKLPRLPLPALDDTLDRYLAASKPLVSQDQFEQTLRLVDAERKAGSVLNGLHKQLEAKESAQTEPSFVANAWDAMYLEGRWPLAINSNPASVSSDKVFGDASSQVARAARMVAAMVDFALKVESATLAPDVFKSIPVDMRQYERMFASTRLPRRGCDVWHKAEPDSSRHIIVLRREHFWIVPVLDPDTNAPLSVQALEASLSHVCDESDHMSAASGNISLAALTATHRDTWADARTTLEQHSPINVASLGAIDDALFALCLDATAVGDVTDVAVRTSLCGDNTTAPRWYDKGVTMVISSDGVPMGQFEHSWGDGISVMRMTAEVWQTLKYGAKTSKETREVTDASELAVAAQPHLLQWEIPVEVERAKLHVAAEYEQICSALQLSCLRFDAWGAAQLKAWGASPDGCIQAALQLAFFRTVGHTPSTYESCSTAHFSAGRTETIRSATAESAAFVQAVVDGAPPQTQAQLLRASAKRHSAVAREAAQGQGFDRHLFALKCLAPSDADFFNDPTYHTLSGNELSTSVLTLEFVRQSGFGPVHPEGYGVSYHTPQNELRFCTTTYRPRSAESFNEELRNALLLVGQLLSGGAGAGSKL